LATGLLDLLQRLIQVGDLDVEGHAVGLHVGRRGADATTDATTLAAADHPVPHGVVGLDVPLEHLAVEPLQLFTVLADHLEMHYRVGHLRTTSSHPSDGNPPSLDLSLGGLG